MNKTVNYGSLKEIGAPEPKDVEIKLRGDLILRLPDREHYLRIKGKDVPNLIEMAVDFLQAATDISSPRKDLISILFLRDYLIKILEEKFGMSVREKK